MREGHVSLQLTPDLVARLRAVQEATEAGLSLPIKVSFSAVTRKVLEVGLDELERRAATSAA